MDRNNESNQWACGHALRNAELALSRYYNGWRLSELEQILRDPEPRFRGTRWTHLREKIAEVRRVLHCPCHCWVCSLGVGQWQRVQQETRLKAASLERTYGPLDEGLFVGAYAEVVFGVRFDLPINQKTDFDSGVDFEVPCPDTRSKRATINVKGTTKGTHRNGEIYCAFPFPSEEWLSRQDHFYVLLHVLDRKHVICRGFSRKTDRMKAAIYSAGNRRFLSSYPSRGEEELNVLLTRCREFGPWPQLQDTVDDPVFGSIPWQRWVDSIPSYTDRKENPCPFSRLPAP